MVKESENVRFEKLLENYAIALHLTYQLFDSGLLEKKIKISNEPAKIAEAVRHFLPLFAHDIRYASQTKGSIINGVKYFEGSSDIANAYFDDLYKYGDEWEYSDLQDLFYKFKDEAETKLAEKRSGITSFL